MIFDLIVVGGGPAGISCANEAKRLGLNVALIEKNQLGGSVRYARKIENFPPFPSISGRTLFKHFQKFVGKSNIFVILDDVEEISLFGNLFQTRNKSGNNIKGKSVFLATGQVDIVPEEYSSFGHLIRKSEDILSKNLANKKVVVYGGGDVAFDLALSIFDAKAKTMIVCRSEIKAKPILLQEATERKIKILKNSTIKDIQKLKGKKVLIINEIFKVKEIVCDEIFFATGKKPLFPILNLPTKIENFDHSTLQNLSKMGVFLGGDLIRGKNRNIAVAIGDGVKAAFDANNFLKGRKNGLL